MLIPIALGLNWPDRVPDTAAPVDWTRPETWEFFPLDDEAFPAVALARRAGETGGTAPAVYNAANEVCVEAFRTGRLRFVEIVDVVAGVLEAHRTQGAALTANAHDATSPGVPSEEQLTVDDILAADAWARAEADRLILEGEPTA
jgi:1-deoxy-D-xylulose-5-phosphate reductoisomerase